MARAVALAADPVKPVTDDWLSSSDFNRLSLDRLLTSEASAASFSSLA
jgi:hypothetical protein